ncbi:hypothetical protein L1887_18967 [Cichorium endivia]|nr:hypothetical protein L1887_18967 [Cichorium endivia]
MVSFRLSDLAPGKFLTPPPVATNKFFNHVPRFNSCSSVPLSDQVAQSQPLVPLSPIKTMVITAKALYFKVTLLPWFLRSNVSHHFIDHSSSISA